MKPRFNIILGINSQLWSGESWAQCFGVKFRNKTCITFHVKRKLGMLGLIIIIKELRKMGKQNYTKVAIHGKIYKVYIADIKGLHTISVRKRPRVPNYDAMETSTEEESIWLKNKLAAGSKP